MAVPNPTRDFGAERIAEQSQLDKPNDHDFSNIVLPAGYAIVPIHPTEKQLETARLVSPHFDQHKTRYMAMVDAGRVDSGVQSKEAIVCETMTSVFESTLSFIMMILKNPEGEEFKDITKHGFFKQFEAAKRDAVADFYNNFEGAALTHVRREIEAGIARRAALKKT